MNDQTMRLAVEAGFLDGDLELFPETIERFADLVRQDYLRELKALKPVAYAENPINFYICKDDTSTFIYASKEKTTTFNKPLIALDEVTK